MLQTQTLSIKGHCLVLPGAVQTRLELKSSVLEAIKEQCFHLTSVVNFIVFNHLKP